jgi:hypothetical protein
MTLVLTPGQTRKPGGKCPDSRTTLPLASDTIPMYANLDVSEGVLPIPCTVQVDLREYVAGLQKIQRLGGRILPGHELRVLDQTAYP